MHRYRVIFAGAVLTAVFAFFILAWLPQRQLSAVVPMDALQPYTHYVEYVDAMERQGKAADPQTAMDAVLDQLEAAGQARAKEIDRQDDPANDKTLSPFFCSPINK